MDNYQAIYDAVRSKITNGDIGEAVERAVRDANIAHHCEMVSRAYQIAAGELERPSVVYRPSLGRDGNQWCALYGANLAEGVAGFGDSPALAMRAFDVAWCEKLSATKPQ